MFREKLVQPEQPCKSALNGRSYGEQLIRLQIFITDKNVVVL